MLIDNKQGVLKDWLPKSNSLLANNLMKIWIWLLQGVKLGSRINRSNSLLISSNIITCRAQHREGHEVQWGWDNRWIKRKEILIKYSRTLSRSSFNNRTLNPQPIKKKKRINSTFTSSTTTIRMTYPSWSPKSQLTFLISSLINSSNNQA